MKCANICSKLIIKGTVAIASDVVLGFTFILWTCIWPHEKICRLLCLSSILLKLLLKVLCWNSNFGLIDSEQLIVLVNFYIREWKTIFIRRGIVEDILQQSNFKKKCIKVAWKSLIL